MVVKQVKAFNAALNFVRKLGLKSRYEWSEYCSIEGLKPADIPEHPNKVYKAWKGWKHWLGQFEEPEFLDFDNARKFVHSLNLKSSKEWKLYCNWDRNDFGIKPPNIPASPHVYYKDSGWNGYGDWLGTNNLASFQKEYLSFEEARTFARKLKLTSSEQWILYCKGEIKGLPKKPINIPTNASRKYANSGWNGMDDFLNATYHRHQKRVSKYLPYEEAKAIVHQLGLKNMKEWIAYAKGELRTDKPIDSNIPKTPEIVYKDFGWKGFGDWLGTGTIAPFQRKYKSFKEAREFARGLGLTSSEQWITYCKGELKDLPKKPEDIPTNVSRRYKNEGWVSYKDFLWTNIHRANKSKFVAYDEAREFVKNLGLTNYKEWKKYARGEMKNLPPKPNNIPSNPAGVYEGKGWIGIGDWLGSKAFAYAHQEYRSFNDARNFARSLGLTSSEEWVKYCKGELSDKPEKPLDIPANVVRKYADKGWKGFKDFLWSDKHRRDQKTFAPFEEAKAFARNLNLKSEKQWKNYCDGKLIKEKGLKPINIPPHPEAFYRSKGWKSWSDWLTVEELEYA